MREEKEVPSMFLRLSAYIKLKINFVSLATRVENNTNLEHGVLNFQHFIKKNMVEFPSN